jgi:hypothetical protein
MPAMHVTRLVVLFMMLVLKQANAVLVSGRFFGAVENRPALLVA